MVIEVDRFVSDADTTISQITVDGEFVCFGLEDEYRETKLSKETRIPAGTYQIKLRKVGTHHKKYSVRFADIHKGMLHIQNVPKFTGILIHCGNTDEDTAGCLLVGSQAITEPGDMKIINSTAAYRRLYSIVVNAAEAGNLTITFLDNDLHKSGDEMTANSDFKLPPAGKKLTKKQTDELFDQNAEERDKMAIGAGALVGALLDALEQNAETYIRLEDAVPKGHKCEYILVQGRQDIIKPLAKALGFKNVTHSVLEVYNA